MRFTKFKSLPEITIFHLMKSRSGPMRRVSNEPRQVRKEAAVVSRKRVLWGAWPFCT